MSTTDQYEGLIAETIAVKGHEDDFVTAYLAKPLGPGPFPAMVLFHHRPGWDEWYKELARKFAYHGYIAICPDLYARVGHGEPDDVAARANAEGGIADAQVVGDSDGCIDFLRALPIASGKIGVMGTCSGGRHAFLAAALGRPVDALVNCWGGRVVMDDDELDDKRPVSPIDYTADLPCPVIGIFGNDDKNPSPESVDVLEEKLKEHGKDYEFHRYDDAGHGFFYYDRPNNYRAHQAMDGWEKIWDFLERTLR